MPSPAQKTIPEVSVIVPARNEEDCLARCLQSLVSQQGVEFEVMVVDDHSTDRTRELAESFPGVDVRTADPLRPGWTGKNNAVWTGTRHARGEWLLFTDADTFHFPNSLRLALAEAKEQGAEMLSYSPRQEVHGFWERAVMPLVFADLARTYRPSDVRNPKHPAAAANGQYVLIRRATYDALGGHAAIAGEILEDVHLARRVKRSGRKLFFRYGGERVQTRMYRNVAQMFEGWTKNLALVFPNATTLAVMRVADFMFLTLLPLASVMIWTRGARLAAYVVGAAAALLWGAFTLRTVFSGFGWRAVLLPFFGLPVYAYLLARSALNHRRGEVTWKGRSYRRAESKVLPSESNDVPELMLKDDTAKTSGEL